MGEAERFARLMRELKERAGLSYGALARRLHTSTSTLHRYCNGEAVPTEFAVVDRFARACGATRPEAVDLHRAWLLADARRRSLTNPRLTPGRAPEPVPEAERKPERGRGLEPASVGEQGSDSEPVRGAGPGLSVRWYRSRRAVVVAVAGVAAAGVAVVGLTAAGAGRGRGTAASPAAASAAPNPGPSPARTSPPSAGPTPSPASTSPSDPGSKPAPSATAPLRAAVRSHVWAAGCDHAYLARQGPADVPPPPVEADAPVWASAQRAVHAGTQIVEVTLHGAGPGAQAVVLEDLEVRVAARRTPPAWNVYQMSQGCGGALTPAGFAVNLDAPRPLARPVAGKDTGDALPAPAFPLRVSAAEPVVLRVEATTTGCDCDWSLDLRWSAPTGSGTLRLDDNGRPWRTSAAPNRPVYGFAHEQGRWSR
ncbi:helix-turn-helix domain-containing protein [Streptomyces sp. APSN-46.1]|uniref:transcriptional regulator n=1 Tax=Streptomyces sp. APSN-46.1 TaxID=2929049 RepID=UPI001FB36DE0|nr:helix-turn-helix transcriptional regulator [Streptomyces sp. APSN-46.1]MCJ1680222.1 helix-turn-helix domain-containing protein [Streptomyces sp. APSN-46.1]